QPLDSPYKILAADANRSGTVTTFDIVQLRKLILGILDTLPGSTSWRFLPANYVFADTLNPFANAIPENISLANLTQDQLNQDFVGIKLGDLNGNTNAADPRSPRDTAWVELPDLTLLPGVPIALPLVLKKWPALSGFQLELGFDPAQAELQWVETLPGSSLTINHLAQSKANSLAISWDDAAQLPGADDSILLVLHLLPARYATLRTAVRLQSERLAPESYPEEPADIHPLSLRFSPVGDASNPVAASWQCFPNPFSEAATFVFELAEPGEVRLLISDAAGRHVLSRQAYFPAGRQQWRIDGQDLPAAGAYRCRLETSSQVFTAGVLIYMR
ncbi:MAG: hypothetical protein ABIQ93_09760, partial [Saprospiraceae bacterium]